MKLKEKLEVQRFVILKIKFAQVKDGRVFVNVNDVIELKEAFDKFAKSMSVVVSLDSLRPSDINFFKNSFLGHDYGDQKLSFFVKNPEDNSVIELVSMQHRIKINDELLSIVHDVNNYEVFLN